MSQRYMLDTNVVSHIMQGAIQRAGTAHRLARGAGGDVNITLAELEYGLHRKGPPPRLRNVMTQVLLRMDVLPWDEAVATCYGAFCATLETQGINPSDFDMMIAAHAVTVNATLVSRDKAFAQVPAGPTYHLKLEVW